MNLRIAIALTLALPTLAALAQSPADKATDAPANAQVTDDSVAPAAGQPKDAWLDRSAELAAKQDAAAKPPDPPAPPLPFHTIEGYGGGSITPMAYLVNPGPKGSIFGLPSAAFSNVVMGRKNLQAFTLTETLFGRLELGYGLDRFGVGTLDDDIRSATGVDIRRDEVWLHNFNLRGLLLEENSFGLPLPAITLGAFQGQRRHLADQPPAGRGAEFYRIPKVQRRGLHPDAASKMLVGDWTFNRPLIVSAGLRESEAASSACWRSCWPSWKATTRWPR